MGLSHHLAKFDILFIRFLWMSSQLLNVNVTGAYYTVLAILHLLEATNKRRHSLKQEFISPLTVKVMIAS
jgi:hypothetical protein